MAVLAPLVALVAFALPASAVTINSLTACGDALPDVTGNVSPSDRCWVIDATANVDENFSYNDDVLTFVDKDESTSETDTGLTLTGGTKAGLWTIDNYDMDLTYFLVFKDGDVALPGVQVGYRLSGETGTYTSPFYGLNGKDEYVQKDISFWALFTSEGDGPITRRNDTPPVPLPAGLPLLLSAIGLGYVVKRHKTKKAA